MPRVETRGRVRDCKRGGGCRGRGGSYCWPFRRICPRFHRSLIHTVAVTPVHIVREAYKYKSDSPFSEAELRMQPRGLFVKRIFSGEHAGQRVLRVELIPNKNMWNIFTEQTSEPHTSSLHIIAKRPHVYRIPFVGHCPTRFLFSFQIARQVFRDKLPSGERPISSSYYVPAFLHLRTDSFLFRAYVRLSLFFSFSSIRVWHNIPVNIYDRIFVLNWSLYWKFKKFRTEYQKVYGPFQSIFRNYNNSYACVLHITI